MVDKVTLRNAGVKRQDAQRNAFTRWVNSKLKQRPDSPTVNDLYKDLRDGDALISLLEALTGRKMRRVKGKLRLHKLNNVNLALDLLKDYQVKLVNIGNTDIVDGEPIPTLGLIWSMIYRFQIQGALIDINPGDGKSSYVEENAEKTILEWCSKAVEGYEGVDVKNFSTSWKDGLAFNALIHRYKPNLFHYENVLPKSPTENLEHAFSTAETAFGVHRLLEPSDLQREPIDSRLVVMYVSTLYEKLKELDPKTDNTVSIEEIEEFLSYIRTELDYLSGCEDYFNSASDTTPESDEDVINQYQDVINFIENLQPHQIKVGELVDQIEALIDAGLIPEEDSEILQKELDRLKNSWQIIFDKTTIRQERLRGLLLNIVDKPLKAAYDSLQKCRERLIKFSKNPTELPEAWDQYQNLMTYIDDLRNLETELEDIRTGKVGGDAIAVLSDEDEQLVANNIKELIDNFMELGQNVAESKYRISENFYESLSKQMEDIENLIKSTQQATAEENNNNNPANGDLNKRLELFKDLHTSLTKAKPDLDHVSEICERIDENFDLDENSLNELKEQSRTLNEDYIEQLRCLEDLIEQSVHQLDSRGKLESWKSDFEAIMVWIREKQKELESMDDLESSLHMLEDAASKIESLYSEITNYQGKIDSVVQVGTKFISEDEVDNASAPSIQSDIRSLETTWELLREKCTSIQLSIQEKMLIKQSQEREYMAEWNETRIKIDDWLTSAENEAGLFDKAHEYISDVEVQVAEHEELVFRLATEEKTINDLLEVGEILSTEKIRQSDNKMKVKNELKTLKKRKMKLNARLVGQQESLTSYLDHLARIETAEFEAWIEKYNVVDSTLVGLHNVESNQPFDSVDGAKDSIQAEEAFITEIEALQPDVDHVVDDGQTLIADGKMGKLKRQSIRSAIKGLEDVYEKKLREATSRLREMNEELLDFQQKQQEKITSWINKADMFYRWIETECKEIDGTFANDDDDYDFESILEEEQIIKELKSSVDSRSSIFESLLTEGETLKSSKSIERDHSEEHENIVNLLESTDSKWKYLNDAICEKLQRVINLLSAKQGQLLAVCMEQLTDIEKALNGLGPVSDGFDTLSNDAEYLSNIFMMIGQIKANVNRFDKYAKEFQESPDVSNNNKFEVRESNELLQTRMNAVENSADERKSLLHDKIIDVLTESMVALSDTVGNLEEKCDEISVPDNLDTIDLVERNMNLEDILRRLIACEVSLKDIESLGGAAESYMLLETGEGDDINREVSHRKAFISHVQQLAREKKSRIYGLLVYTFKRRMEEFHKTLDDIEDGSKEDSGASMDLKNAIEKIKNNETLFEQLDDVQKNVEDISIQINEMMEGNVLVAKDEDEIQQKSSSLAEHLSEAATTLKLNSNSLKQGLTTAVAEKLKQLEDWLSMMERRREGDDQIGPDSMTIKKQITEMNVVESQLKEKRLTPHLHYEDEIATTYLDSKMLSAMKEADHDWQHLSDWIAHRTKVLHATQEAWEQFRQEEVDLLDYLRDKEKQIKNFEPINLEDEESVTDRLAQLKDLLTAMEEHKDDVSSLHKVSDEVIELIGQSSPMANNIKSQVADIHDCWNNTVRQIIEAISKLNFAKEMLQNMEAGISEVREWLDDAKSILKFYTVDVPDDVMEDLKPQVIEKCEQEPLKRSTLNKVNSMSRELLDDIDGPSHDVIHADLKNLNKDWENVTSDLEKKKNMKKRPCCWWCYRRWFLKYGYYN